MAKRKNKRPQHARHQLQPFRFLRLAPELRNRVYEMLAVDLFKTPLMIAYTPRKHRTLDREALEPSDAHDVRRRGHPRKRLALLCTCRTIRDEAWKIFFEAMSIDMRKLHLQSSLDKMITFSSLFDYKLQYIQRLEIQFRDFATFCCSARLLSKSAASRRWLNRDEPSEDHVKQLWHIRTLLFDLKSITVFTDKTCEDNAVGWWVFLSLGYKWYRQVIERLFPHLTDMVASNGFGDERYHRTAQGWQFHYSRQSIPQGEDIDLEELRSSFELIDHDTGLLTSQAIAYVQQMASFH